MTMNQRKNELDSLLSIFYRVHYAPSAFRKDTPRTALVRTDRLNTQTQISEATFESPFETLTENLYFIDKIENLLFSSKRYSRTTTTAEEELPFTYKSYSVKPGYSLDADATVFPCGLISST